MLSNTYCKPFFLHKKMFLAEFLYLHTHIYKPLVVEAQMFSRVFVIKCFSNVCQIFMQLSYIVIAYELEFVIIHVPRLVLSMKMQ